MALQLWPPPTPPWNCSGLRYSCPSTPTSLGFSKNYYDTKPASSTQAGSHLSTAMPSPQFSKSPPASFYPPWFLLVYPVPLRSHAIWAKEFYHSGTSKRVTRAEQEDRSRKYHPHFPISSLWISVSVLEYFTRIQNRQKDCTGVEFAKTHVLNIWNSVHVFGIETEREIFNPASVMGKRLLAGLKKHARPCVCVCACAQLHRGKHAQRGRQQKSPAPDGSLGHLALIW